MSLGLTDGKGVADVWRSGAAEAGGESCVCYFGIEVVGVEVFTQPLTPLGVLWMSRIGEDFEQLTVAPGAAAILGWTPALSGGADGTGQSLNVGRAVFDHERMFPVVAEVVADIPQMAGGFAGSERMMAIARASRQRSWRSERC